MDNKKNLLCISTIDWDFLWQRHHIMMSVFSQHYNIFFVENMGFRNPKLNDLGRIFKKISRKKTNSYKNPTPNNLKIIKPLVLPPNGFFFRLLNDLIFIPALNRHLQKRGLTKADLAIIYLPSHTTVKLLDLVGPEKVLFDYVANFEGHPGKPKDYNIVEEKLFNKSDIVIADSHYLYEKIRNKHDKVYEIHQGVNAKLFNRAFRENKKYKSVCFFGAIDDRFDWGIIDALKNAGAEIKLIGSAKSDIPDGYDVMGPFNPEELVLELEKVDVLIIPYIINEFTKGIMPAKIFECMATGKPTIVTALPSYNKYSDVLYICSNKEEVVETFHHLNLTETPDIVYRRMDYAREYSLENNINNIIELVEGVNRNEQS